MAIFNKTLPSNHTAQDGKAASKWLAMNSGPKAGRQWKNLYVSTALVFFNALLLFIVLNLLMAPVYLIKDAVSSSHAPARSHWAFPESPERLFNLDGSPVATSKRTKYQLEWFDFNAYENVDAGTVGQYLDEEYEISQLGFLYQPWVQFSEPPFKGKHLTVGIDSRGFIVRRSVNPPNSQNLPTVSIFTVGGSTTIGYGSADESTWPSRLSEILNDEARRNGLGIHVEVLNYGRVYYYPSQETALVTDLLKSGHRPNLIIFMDGLNWGTAPYIGQDVPQFSKEVSHIFEERQFAPDMPLVHVDKLITWVPMIRLANTIHQTFLLPKAKAQGTGNSQEPQFTPEYVINMFRQNRQIAATISNIYGTKTLFFLQPNAYYNYPLSLYRSSLPEDILKFRQETKQVYERMRDDKGSIYLGDLFEAFGPNRKAIIDDCHYSPAFNQFLAEQVAKHIDLKTLVPRAKLIDESAATGGPRQITARNPT